MSVLRLTETDLNHLHGGTFRKAQTDDGDEVNVIAETSRMRSYVNRGHCPTLVVVSEANLADLRSAVGVEVRARADGDDSRTFRLVSCQDEPDEDDNEPYDDWWTEPGRLPRI